MKRLLFFGLYHMSCGIPVSWPGIKPGPMVVKMLSPNHWTTRDNPRLFFFYWIILALVENQLTIDVWLYFWTLSSIPSIYVSFLMPVPQGVFFLIKKKVFFIWQFQILVEACGLSWSFWDPVPWEAPTSPPLLGVWSLSHWTTREVPTQSWLQLCWSRF